MDIHPQQIPTSRTFDLKEYSQITNILNEILSMDFSKEAGFKILMPKEQRLAKMMGYTIVNEINKGLRMQGYRNNVRYFVYHHDPEHYAIILVSEERLSRLDS